MSITSIIVALLIFNGVIILHEFGHYLAAKNCRVGVVEFSVGFGPKILSFRKRDTRFSLKMLPFGGSCEMLGELNENAEKNENETTFFEAKLWKRALIIAAGPGVNILTALIASFCIIIFSGMDKPIISYVVDGSPAYEAGLQVGDEIICYNGNRIANAREYMTDLSSDGIPEDIEITYLRNGEKETISFESTETKMYRLGIQHNSNSNEILTVSEGSAAEIAGLKEGDTITSIDGVTLTNELTITEYTKKNPLSEKEITVAYTRDGKSYETVLIPDSTEVLLTGFELSRGRTRVSFLEATKGAFGEVSYYTHIVVKSFAMLIKGSAGAKDLSGPIGTIQAIGGSYEQASKSGTTASLGTITNLTALLSAMIGVTNLLPFPSLDGCQLVFFFIEAVRRKSVNEKIIGAINYIGFTCIMLLLAYVTLSDISKLF